MKIVVYNLGCKVNKYECDGLLKALKERGHEVSEELVYADLYILNTCAVTNEAERKSRQCVSRCLKLNPSAKIVVCGCASQNNPKQFADKENVSFVIGTAKKEKIIDNLESKGILINPLPKEYEDCFSPEVVRTRAYVKVQDGCNNYCSYCLIPYVRGASRSRKIESVVEECKRLSAACKEIVLTGIDISSYGKNIGSSLSELIKNLCDIDCRIRLSSLEVNVIDAELLEALKKLKKFCPQFHLSLQSGEDGVLKKMNRHYTTAVYLQKVELIREFFPDAAITTDLICGFPTEDEESFEKTLKFMDEVGFAQVHIFGYSPREGTVAARYKLLPPDVVKTRANLAAKVADRNKEKYLKDFVGSTLEVLSEDVENRYLCGYSRQYIKCYLDKGESDNIYFAKVEEIKDGVAYCKVVEI
ncbi:MAG: tRNA (N(6)-L-threonylcarbamoyladenosine(37)-C(2))-methylthiotransferase MtaB [Clostridia bacterium]|nr:tRNA (N(6)-L-threonylcarbamoyladenosine(37)-C(2))-methylthiotransferase MtaB [Clostridia bacterium]MDE7329031.1 tRNA (N(6)-L-threonylcarbamoyladenosine(37)-C(2))-methylthiotransferase MtaB [Clostridia bacterium]